MALVMTEGWDFEGEAYLSYNGWSKTDWTDWGTQHARFTAAEKGCDLSCGASVGYYGKYFRKNLPGNYSTLVMGGSFKMITNQAPITTTSNGFFNFADGSSIQCHIAANPNYGIDLYANGVLVASTPNNIISYDNWVFVELKVVFHASAGSMELRINKAVKASATGLNTAQSGNAYANRVSFNGMNYSGGALSIRWDDCYVDDTDYLGPLMIHTFLPDDDHANNDFVPSASAECWQDIDPSTWSNSQYAEGSNTGDQLAVLFNATAFEGTIHAVKFAHASLYTDLFPKWFKPLVISNGSDYLGDRKELQTSAYYNEHIYETDPDDSNPWTQTKIEAAGWGLDIVSTTTSSTTTTSTTTTTV